MGDSHRLNSGQPLMGIGRISGIPHVRKEEDSVKSGNGLARNVEKTPHYGRRSLTLRPNSGQVSRISFCLLYSPIAHLLSIHPGYLAERYCHKTRAAPALPPGPRGI